MIITMPKARRSSLFLWEFLLDLLDGEDARAEISWIDRDKGIFVMKDQNKIAKRWGKVKGRSRMDRIKLGRALRNYYKTGILAKVPRWKATYRFVNVEALSERKTRVETMVNDDLPEINLNDDSVLALIGDEKTHYSTLSTFDLEDCKDIFHDETFLTEAHVSELIREINRGTDNSTSFNEFTEHCNESYGFEFNNYESKTTVGKNKEDYIHSTGNSDNLAGNQPTRFHSDVLKASLLAKESLFKES